MIQKEYGDCTGPLGFPMITSEARELEKLLETGEYSPIKLFKGDSFESFNPGENADISVVTDSSVDRDNEIIDPKGIDWSSFRKNPVVTFGHDYHSPPIGKSIWQKQIGPTWKAKTVYSKRPDNFPLEKEWFPETVFHLIKEGTLPGKSISGAAKYTEPTPEQKQQGIRRIASSLKVYEYAVVTIQSNTNAITEIVSRSFSKFNKDFLQHSFPEVWENVKKHYEAVEKLEELVIKEYTTVDAYKAVYQQRFEQKTKELLDNIPNEVNNALKRYLGRII